MNNNHVNKIVSYYIYTVFFLITSNGVNFFFLPLILMNDDIITVTRNGSILDEFLPLNLDWILPVIMQNNLLS